MALIKKAWKGVKKMKVGLDEKKQEEMIRRVLKRSFVYQQAKEKQVYAQDIMDALQELSRLPALEFERIFMEVGNTYDRPDEGFLSVKNQMFDGLKEHLYLEKD